MKVLILNGSPRPDGDTAYVLQKLKEKFPGDTVFETLNAFEVNIKPCNDCRYCWENEGCRISDQMDVLWKDDYEVLILASPLYMSFVTPPLFSIISRLNVVWSNNYVNRLGQLMLSLPFPLTHTVRAAFTAYGAPSDRQTLLSFAGAYGFIILSLSSGAFYKVL